MSSVEDQNAGSPWEDRASIIAFSLGASSSVKGGTLPDDFMKTMNIIDEERASEHVSPATSIDRRHQALSSWKESTASDADPLFLAAARDPDRGFALGADQRVRDSSACVDRVSNTPVPSPSRKNRADVRDAGDSSDSDNSTVPDMTASQAAMDHEMSFLSDSNGSAMSTGSNKSSDDIADGAEDDGDSGDMKKRTSSSRKGSWSAVLKSVGDWVGGMRSSSSSKGDEADTESVKVKAKSLLEDL